MAIEPKIIKPPSATPPPTPQTNAPPFENTRQIEANIEAWRIFLGEQNELKKDNTDAQSS